jgi:phytoene synthase
MSFDADLTACAALVQRADPDRFAAAMASPVAARHVLFPLYAFNVEVARAPWVTQEPMIAEMRLQWWRDVLEQIATGAPVRRHEVATPLARALDAADARALDALVEARRRDIERAPFQTDADLDAYLDATAGGLMRVAARALARPAGDPPDAAAEEALQRLARGTGLARYRQAVPDLEARGRVPLVDGRPEAIGARVRETLATSPGPRELRRLLPPASRPAMIEGFLTAALLRQALRDPACVARGSMRVAPLRRTLLLWRWS